MHELTVTRSIFQIVLKHALKSRAKRVISVNLEIGAVSDLQGEWLQRYFDRLSRGTVVEGAELRVSRVPAVFRCDRCQGSFEIHSLLEEELRCGECHSRQLTLVSGREYHVQSMQVE